MIESFCIPALLTLLFGIAFVLYDLTNGNSFGSIMRLLMVLFYTLTLQLFCQNRLEWFSWVIILLPLILFSIITGVIIFLSEVDVEVDEEKVEPKCEKRKLC